MSGRESLEAVIRAAHGEFCMGHRDGENCETVIEREADEIISELRADGDIG